MRDDYKFSYLHEFLRLQSTSVSMIPKKAEELPVNQAITERFMCVTDGEVELKLISGVFSQNMYQGVFEDLSAE